MAETVSQESTDKRERMAEAVRQVVSRRERAPRSPRLERALKRLIWRYTRLAADRQGKQDFQE